MQEPEERPLGVGIVGVLLALNGTVALVAAFSAFSPTPAGTLGAILGAFFGLGLLSSAYGVWRSTPWGWLGAVALETLNAFFSALTLLAIPGATALWINLILALVAIASLIHPRIPRVFGG